MKGSQLWLAKYVCMTDDDEGMLYEAAGQLLGCSPSPETRPQIKGGEISWTYCVKGLNHFAFNDSQAAAS